MMRRLRQVFLSGILLSSLFWLVGCYTQLATTHDNREEEYTSTPTDTVGGDYEQSYANDNEGNGNDDWAPDYRVGFSYYYPTLGFAFSTYDPWYWRYGGWYYYDPFICGTYYPAIYAGGYPYWHYPGFSYYPYYPHHSYAFGGRGRGTTRTIGSTRGGGTVMGGGRNDGGYRSGGSPSGVDVPGAYRTAASPRGGSSSNTPRVSSARPNSGRTHGAAGAARRSPSVRGGTTRSGSSRGGSHATPPRTYTPPPRDSGSRGGSGRSYSPPPSPPPAQSTPPSNGGNSGRSSGSSGSSGGGRGGRSR